VRRLAALLVLLAACRREAPPATADGGPPPQAGAFTQADLAAAAALDARLARLAFIAAELETALAFERADKLRILAARMSPPLEAAAAEAERALDGISDPRDRERAVPLVEAARRWPGLLSAAVAERLAPEGRPPGPALGALAATDEEVARRLDAYRRFRSTWRLAAGPPEGEGALLFLDARRSLEAAEARLGQALPGPGAPGGPLDPATARTGMAAAVERAREASGRVDPERRAAARRFVDALRHRAPPA